MSTRVVVQVMEDQPGADPKLTTIDVTRGSKVQAVLAAVDGLYQYGRDEITAAVSAAKHVAAQVDRLMEHYS